MEGRPERINVVSARLSCESAWLVKYVDALRQVQRSRSVVYLVWRRLMAVAVMFSEYGGPEVLELGTISPPVPGPGQVRVRVHATAVNPIDLWLRNGRMDGVIPLEFPTVPGHDVSGVVDEAGDGVTFSKGDEVFGFSTTGAYSNFALMDQPFAKPQDLSFEKAAAIVTVGETAYRALVHMDVKAGETLVIHGAGGGVGSVAAQLAVERGIQVVGTAGERDHERLLAFGAIPVLYGDRWADRVKAVAPNGVDYVLDAAGAGLLADSIDLVGGITDRVLTIADMSFAEHHVRLTGLDPRDRFPEALPSLAARVASGELDILVWRTYPLADAAQAHAEIEAGRNRGKVVLLP